MPSTSVSTKTLSKSSRPLNSGFLNKDRVIKVTIFKQIEQWASDRNLIEGATRQAQFMKLAEELGEVAECLAKGLPVAELEKEIGDMIVVLTILAAQSGTDVESCAVAAYDKIKHRTGRMVDGVFIKDGD